jgi:hypothetical protein
VQLNDDFNPIKRKIEKEHWTFIYTGVKIENNDWLQTYDSFNFKIDDSSEKVVIRTGIDNGEEEYLYFKRIKGKWYLIKWEDLST